jgi:protein-L-isoaspartate(D-aspartate) O-methyltransferase
VLDVGTGSGYGAAVLSHLAGRVLSVERHPTLAEEARARLAGLGLANVAVRVGDGTEGLTEEAPFDAILCAAAARAVPEAWKRQLAVGGRIVLPIGPEGGPQELVVVTRTGESEWKSEDRGWVAFVPLVGGVAPG